MPHLLRIDASSRKDGSVSRTLGDQAEARWRAANPSGADFLAPYLNVLLGFLGIEDIQIVGIEGTTGDLAALSVRQGQAIAAIETHAA